MKAHKQTEDTRISLLEQSIVHINQTLNRIEQRFDRIDDRFNRVDGEFDRMDEKFDSIHQVIRSNFMWMLGLYASTIGIILSGVYFMINN